MRNIPNEGDRSRRNHGIHGLGGRLRGQRLACQYFRCLFSHKCLQYRKRKKIMATSKCTWSKQVITSLSIPQPNSKFTIFLPQIYLMKFITQNKTTWRWITFHPIPIPTQNLPSFSNSTNSNSNDFFFLIAGPSSFQDASHT